MSKGDNVDRLADARRLAGQAVGRTDPGLALADLGAAVRYLVDAIEELCAQARLERNPETVELLHDAEKKLRQAAHMEVVTVLLQRNQGRRWLDRGNYTWTFEADHWVVRDRLDQISGIYRPGDGISKFGPFTAVEEK